MPTNIRQNAKIDWSCPLNRGLVGWWNAEAAPRATVWRDLTKESNHGTLTNSPVWIPSNIARNGLSLDFQSGSNQYVTLGRPSVLKFGAGDFTYSLIFKWTTTASNQILVGESDSVSDNERYMIARSDNKLGFFTRDSASDAISAISTTDIDDGAWHFGTGTRNGDTGAIHLDGVQEHTNTNAASGDSDAVADVIIGAREGPTLPFDGRIKEVRMWNRGLPRAECCALYFDYMRGYQRTILRVGARRRYTVPTAVGGTTPKGPLGHPLMGAMGGPI